MQSFSLRRAFIYVIATVVTVGIFFSHDTLMTAHYLHNEKKHMSHVDQNFISRDRLRSHHGGDISLRAAHQIKKHKKLKKVSSSASEKVSSASAGSGAGKGAKPILLNPKRFGVEKDLDEHRNTNPSFKKKDPFEEKCVTNTLEDRLRKPFKDSYVAHRGNHAYRSNFKVPKYWPMHMRGNNICKHIKWQVVGQVNNKVLKVLPLTDTIRDTMLAGRSKFDSCAVVGNGGGSLLKTMGKEIDAHEAVIRFNGGPTVGFEKHVGSRTTFRVDNSEHFMFHEKHTNETVLQHITSSKNFKQLFKISDRAALKDVLQNLHVIDPFFQYYVMNLHNDGAPSNGFYGIALAHLLCFRITLYGYQKNWKHQNIPYHYYDKVEPNENQYGRDVREVSRFNEILDSINAVARMDEEWLRWRDQRNWHLGKIVLAEELEDHTFARDGKGDEGEEEEGEGEEGEEEVMEAEVVESEVHEKTSLFSSLFGRKKQPEHDVEIETDAEVETETTGAETTEAETTEAETTEAESVTTDGNDEEEEEEEAVEVVEDSQPSEALETGSPQEPSAHDSEEEEQQQQQQQQSANEEDEEESEEE